MAVLLSALAVRDFSAACATSDGVFGNLGDAGLDLVRGRGHHLQVAVQMLDVVALRLLRLPERVDRLLGADAPDDHRADILAVLVDHRLDLQVELHRPQRDGRLVRKLVLALMLLGAQNLVDICRDL